MAGRHGASSETLVFRQIWPWSNGLTSALTHQPVTQSVITASLFSPLFFAFFHVSLHR